jgi:Kef-type K+ transport system membrane component KefB
VSISSLDGLTSWLWFAIFLCIAFVCKFGGSYLGARFSGMNRQDSAVVGSLMNTRGLMELIVLSIGLQMHALSPGVYAILVFVALVTTSMTVPFIRRWGGMEATAGERQAAAERT